MICNLKMEMCLAFFPLPSQAMFAFKERGNGSWVCNKESLKHLTRRKMNPEESCGIQEKKSAKTLIYYTGKPNLLLLKNYFVVFVYKNK